MSPMPCHFFTFDFISLSAFHPHLNVTAFIDLSVKEVWKAEWVNRTRKYYGHHALITRPQILVNSIIEKNHIPFFSLFSTFFLRFQGQCFLDPPPPLPLPLFTDHKRTLNRCQTMSMVLTTLSDADQTHSHKHHTLSWIISVAYQFYDSIILEQICYILDVFFVWNIPWFTKGISCSSKYKL